MHARLISVVAESQASQQKDNLCGPFWAARVLNESGFATWGDQPIDQDPRSRDRSRYEALEQRNQELKAW